MNLPNKITVSRIILAFVIIAILLFPFSSAGINLPQLFIAEKVVVDIKYIIAGVLFIIASLTDFVDGVLARRYDMVTDAGKMLDAIADKVLVNSVLIILAASGFISPIVPVVIVVRDSIVNSIKMIAGNNGQVVQAIMSGKIKTVCLMMGIILTLFYNLPFELWNIRISDVLLVIACAFAIYSALQYYNMNKKYIFKKENN